MNIVHKLNRTAGTFSLGCLTFRDKVVVTDPGYPREVWCRLNNIKIVPGDYTGIVRLRDEGVLGVRVATIGIYKNKTVFKQARRKTWTHIEEIGVDAGLAGIFSHKADFTDKQWYEFCDDIYDGSAWAIDDPLVRGFFSCSGYGDGSYDVIGHPTEEDPDVFDAIEIRFL